MLRKRVPPCSPVTPVVSDLSAETARIRAEIKSLVLKNLCTSPVLSGFYEQLLIKKGVNPKQAKILADQYRNFSGVNMSSQSCTHLKVTGVRCDSPALRGEQFCYFHQRMHRGVRTPPQARLHPIALIEDEESIQTALMEVINALMRNTIDLKRASLILRALHIAVKNAARVKIGVESRSAVTEIPDYAAHAGTNHVGTDPLVRPASAASAPAPYSELDIPDSAAPQPETPLWHIPVDPPRILTAAERAQKRADLEAAIAAHRATTPAAHITENGQAHISVNHVSLNHVSLNHVGTDPLVRPASAASAPTTNASANTKAPVGSASPGSLPRAVSSGPGNQALSGRSSAAISPNPKPAPSAPPKKKPPLTVKHTPTSKERRSAAPDLRGRARLQPCS